MRWGTRGFWCGTGRISNWSLKRTFSSISPSRREWASDIQWQFGQALENILRLFSAKRRPRTNTEFTGVQDCQAFQGLLVHSSFNQSWISDFPVRSTIESLPHGVTVIKTAHGLEILFDLSSSAFVSAKRHAQEANNKFKAEEG